MNHQSSHSALENAAPWASSPPAISIFDIHLLVSKICSFLHSRALRCCTLVSHDFYHAFNPFLWKTIRIQHRMTYNRFLRPEAQLALAHHASFVTHVSSVFGSVWELFLSQGCRNLLAIDSPGLDGRPLHPLVNKRDILSLISLITSSPQLITLRVQSFTFKNEAMELFSAALRQHPTLKHLEIGSRYSKSCHRVQSFLWSTFRLETLSLGFTILENEDDSLKVEDAEAIMALTLQEDPMFSVKRLCLPERITDFSHRSMVEILKRFHHVEYLEFSSTYAVWGWPQYLFPVIINNMLHLQHVEFQASDLRGRHLTNIIRACRRLSTFKARFVIKKSDETVDALIECHSESLKCCQLYSTDQLTSPRIIRLLTSCPALEVLDLMISSSWWLQKKMLTLHRIFKARIRGGEQAAVEASDLEKSFSPISAPWVCRDLRVLRIIYKPLSVLHPPTSSAHLQPNPAPLVHEILPRVLYERISALSKLEELRLGLPADISLHRTVSTENQWIQNINEALQAFAKLDRLQKLELRGHGPFISKAELSRVRKKHWKDIQWVEFSSNE